MAMETDRLSEREANFERVASFFGGAPDQTPSMAEVLERARLSWEGEESVPVEWVTMLLCIREWNDNG